MGVLRIKSSSAVCSVVDMHCAKWAMEYFGYCLCSKRDGISLAFGIISIVGWGVAAIPQVVTNYNKKSAEGVSVLFLLTWIIGDIFNIIGCMLEPATLPTQYCTALLYLAATLILSFQSLYYEHIYPRMTFIRQEAVGTVDGNECNDDVDAEIDSVEGLHFLPSRSLAATQKPSPGTPTSDVENSLLNEPLLDDVKSTRNSPQPKIKSTLCVVWLMTFFLGIYGYHVAGRGEENIKGKVLHVGRKLSETTNGSVHEFLGIGIGTCLGWGMAAIYLWGRIPQIWLNIKRGNLEGLNPLMFIVTLVTNCSYVASILVSSLEWSKIHPNLPWLVEAGGCACLDFIIIAQFTYFHYRSRSTEQKYVS